MPTITDTAICIRAWDFSETSQTVSLFTREHGIVRGLAKGAKREKGAFSGGFDVLTRGEIVAIIKPGRDLATLAAWHLQDNCRVVRQSLAANRAAQYMADLVHHMLLEHDPHPQLFDAFTNALSALADPHTVKASLLRFQWTLLAETGYQPRLDHDLQTVHSESGAGSVLLFSASAGGVVGSSPVSSETGATSSLPVGTRWPVRRETIALLRRLASGQSSFSNDEAASVRRANRLLACYFREVIGHESAAMRWAFSDWSA